MAQLYVYVLEKTDYYTKILKKSFYAFRNLAEIKIANVGNPSVFFNKYTSNPDITALIFIEYDFVNHMWNNIVDKIKKLKNNYKTVIIFKNISKDEIFFKINNVPILDYLLFPMTLPELDFYINRLMQFLIVFIDNQKLNRFIQLQTDRIKEIVNELRKTRSEKDKLEKEYREKETFIEKKSKELRYKLIKALFTTLEVYYPYFGSHAKRVSLLSRLIAEKLNLNENVIEDIEIAGLLHDIGMISVPVHLMNIPFSQMNQDEIELVKRHPIIGEEIFKAFEEMYRVRKFIRSHHEYYNGTGFPDELKGNDIPIGARIISVSDAYDEISHHGVFMKKPSHVEAINHIVKRKELQFDPRIVTTFLEVLHDLKAQKTKEREVSWKDLEEGMVLAQDIYTKSGVFILAKGTILNKIFLTKLEYYLKSGAIDNKFYIMEEGEKISIEKTLIAKLSLIEPDVDITEEVKII